MVHGDDEGHVVPPQQPAPLSRATENGADPVFSAGALAPSDGDGRSRQQQPLKSGVAALAPNMGSTAAGGSGNTKRRRLRPMELKKQQRQQEEQRKRAKLAASSLAAVAPHNPGAGGATSSPCAVAAAAAAPAVPGQASPSRGAATSRAGLTGKPGKEPLTRSASSPPSIGCTKG